MKCWLLLVRCPGHSRTCSIGCFFGRTLTPPLTLALLADCCTCLCVAPEPIPVSAASSWFGFSEKFEAILTEATPFLSIKNYHQTPDGSPARYWQNAQVQKLGAPDQYLSLRSAAIAEWLLSSQAGEFGCSVASAHSLLAAQALTWFSRGFTQNPLGCIPPAAVYFSRHLTWHCRQAGSAYAGALHKIVPTFRFMLLKLRSSDLSFFALLAADLEMIPNIDRNLLQSLLQILSECVDSLQIVRASMSAPAALDAQFATQLLARLPLPRESTRTAARRAKSKRAAQWEALSNDPIVVALRADASRPKPVAWILPLHTSLSGASRRKKPRVSVSKAQAGESRDGADSGLEDREASPFSAVTSLILRIDIAKAMAFLTCRHQDGTEVVLDFGTGVQISAQQRPLETPEGTVPPGSAQEQSLDPDTDPAEDARPLPVDPHARTDLQSLKQAVAVGVTLRSPAPAAAAAAPQPMALSTTQSCGISLSADHVSLFVTLPRPKRVAALVQRLSHRLSVRRSIQSSASQAELAEDTEIPNFLTADYCVSNGGLLCFAADGVPQPIGSGHFIAAVGDEHGLVHRLQIVPPDAEPILFTPPPGGAGSARATQRCVLL
eukprot:TRINITY_DN6564_c0_g1_i1.p1 TRINITY_DN6564_c0_g1~~TRINITY_DN6564_c0_g1_i1.p1  ORF type:complete len:607 (+),score=81.11 TRINITY_DN6564_c0_g1_i1:901-2721(+)